MTPGLSGTGRLPPSAVPPDAASVLAALPMPVLVLDRANIVRSVNPAAEQFFDAGSSMLVGLPLSELILPHSPLFGLIEAVRQSDASVSEYDLVLDSLRAGHRRIAMQAAPVAELPGHVVLLLNELSIAVKIDRQ
jgi:two-component system nitrogen regulation sensor histidine kinase GlnL